MGSPRQHNEVSLGRHSTYPVLVTPAVRSSTAKLLPGTRYTTAWHLSSCVRLSYTALTLLLRSKRYCALVARLCSVASVNGVVRQLTSTSYHATTDPRAPATTLPRRFIQSLVHKKGIGVSAAISPIKRLRFFVAVFLGNRRSDAADVACWHCGILAGQLGERRKRDLLSCPPPRFSHG